MSTNVVEFIVDLGAGNEFTVASIDDAKAFVRKEREFWGWVLSETSKQTAVGAAARNMRERFGDLQRMLDEPPTTPDLNGQLQSFFSSSFGADCSCPWSELPVSRFVMQIKAQYGDDAARYFLAYHSGQDDPPGQVNHASIAKLLSILWRKGLVDFGANADALQSLHAMETGRFNSFRSDCQTRFAELESSVQQICEQSKASIDEGERRLQNAERQFRDIYQIQEPASYWRKKAVNHLLVGIPVGVAALAVASIGLAALIWYSLHVQKTLRELSVSRAEVAARDSGEAAAPSSLGMWDVIPHSFPLLVGAIALFWFVRILVRIFLSNMHLHADARERVVMANTYLALRTGGHSLDSQGMTLVLAQLFRPTATGIVKDDAAPPTPFDKVNND